MERPEMERDRGLDYIKGAACLLMVLAHGIVADSAGWVLRVKFVGQYAPVLFFASSGAAMTYQARSRSMGAIALFYALFFVLGFSYNGMHVSDYWHALQSDILQCIALCSLILALLLRAMPAQWLILITPIPFILHVALQRWGLPEDFILGRMLVPPGVFPLLPWLGFFLAGAALYRMKDWVKAAVSIGIMALLAVLSMAGVPMDLWNKWNMSWGYFLLSCAGAALAFLLARRVRDIKIKPLALLGRHSLLFLYVHYIPVYALDYLGVDAPWIVWPAILIATPLIMMAFHSLNKRLLNKTAGYWWFWLILLGLVIADPYVFRYKIVIYVLSCVTGILFALNYRSLARLTQPADKASLK